MKTYKVPQFTCGDDIELEINVPTPKELQATTERDYIRVIITNLSYGAKVQYGVAFYRKDREGNWPLKAEFPADTFTGRRARQDALDRASEYLVGRF